MPLRAEIRAPQQPVPGPIPYHSDFFFLISGCNFCYSQPCIHIHTCTPDSSPSGWTSAAPFFLTITFSATFLTTFNPSWGLAFLNSSLHAWKIYLYSSYGGCPVSPFHTLPSVSLPAAAGCSVQFRDAGMLLEILQSYWLLPGPWL